MGSVTNTVDGLINGGGGLVFRGTSLSNQGALIVRGRRSGTLRQSRQ